MRSLFTVNDIEMVLTLIPPIFFVRKMSAFLRLLHTSALQTKFYHIACNIGHMRT